MGALDHQRHRGRELSASSANAAVAPTASRPAGGAPAGSPASGPRIAWARREWLLTAGLAAMVLVTFAPAWQNGFVNYDDPPYVSENPIVQAGLTWRGFVWACTSKDVWWHPLTWLSLMLDTQLFGPAARGYHLTNVVLHLVNTLLLFVLWRRLTAATWQSAVVAALFAVHPLRVESVAWITERKGILSACFGWLALLAYARWASKPALRYYLAVLSAMILSLLAKPMLVTLPLLCLLLDYWPLRRWRPAAAPAEEARPCPRVPLGRLLLEKVPLLALSATSCAVTMWAQHDLAAAFWVLDPVPLTTRLANVALNYVAYLRQTILPVDLAPYYPYPPQGPDAGAVCGAVALLGAITVAALWQRQRRPYLLVGWLWYLVALFPVIGIVQIGAHARADRYTYVPQVGLFVIVVWGLAEIAGRLSVVRMAAWLAGPAVLACLMLLSWKQVQYWHDSVALWQHSVQATASNSVAQHNWADALMRQGQLDEAARHFQIAIDLKPKDAGAHHDLGSTLLQQGHVGEAVEQYHEAVRLDPNMGKAHADLALALMRQDDLRGAAVHAREAVRLDPGLARTHYILGLVLEAQGQLAEAASCLRQAAALEPARAEYHRALAHVRTQQGHATEARAEYRESLQLDPHWPPALIRHALALAADPDPGRRDGRRALREAEQVVQAVGDRDPMALDVLAMAQAEAGLFDAAAATARKAQQKAAAAGYLPLARQIESRVHLYERHQPFRIPAP